MVAPDDRKSVNLHMTSICMLLSNPFRPDPRVLKEAISFTEAGFNITIICWDRLAELNPEEILPSGVKIIRIQNITSGYGIGIRQLLRLPILWSAFQRHLQNINPNIIHCHDFDTLPAGLWFGLFHRIPVIYDAHEYYAELVRPRLKGLIGWLIYRIINLGEKLGAHYSKAVVTVDEKLAAIYRHQNRNVITLGHYPPIKMASNSSSVFSRRELTLIYAGRLSIDRGIFIYADLVKCLLAEQIPTRLILAGTFTPESEKSKFYDYAKDVISSIDYLDWIPYDQISKVYLTGDIGLAILLPEPRYVAATPVKLFEYMACGLPVIASNFPSITEIVNGNNCGVVIDPLADLSEIKKTIVYWHQNKSIPQELGENGRQAVLSKYNWENQVSGLIDLYRKLL